MDVSIKEDGKQTCISAAPLHRRARVGTSNRSKASVARHHLHRQRRDLQPRAPPREVQHRVREQERPPGHRSPLRQNGPEFIRELDGYPVVIEDARRAPSWRPRPHGQDSLLHRLRWDGSVWFSSEMKTLIDDPGIAARLSPPGHYYIEKVRRGDAAGDRVGDRRGVHPRSQRTTPSSGDRRRRGEESPDGGRSLRGAPLRRPDSSLITSIARHRRVQHLRRAGARALLLHRHQGCA